MPHLSAHLRRPELYGISGRKGHGKDTFARLVVEAAQGYGKASDFTVTHFAGALKRIAGRVFGLSDAHMHDPALKATPLAVSIEMDVYLEGLRAETGLPLRPAGKVASSPRELMQFLGTEYVRHANPNYWVQRVLDEVRDTRRVLVPDTRFPNEAEALRSKGGLIIKIVRIDADVDPDAHASEAEIDLIDPDLLLGVRTGDLSLPTKVAQLIALNRFGGAKRYDYRLARRAIAAYLGGMSKEDVAINILEARNTYPLDNLLDYYEVPRRRSVSGRVPHRDVEGSPHKRCCTCETWMSISDFNASSKAWDGLAGSCRLCAAELNRRRYQRQGGGSLLSVFNTTRRFAPRRGLDFTLTFDEVQEMWDSQGGLCWYSGVPMTTDVGDPLKVTLDRLDSSSDYTRENVVLCSIVANLMKKDMTVDTFCAWVARIHNHLSSKVLG